MPTVDQLHYTFLDLGLGGWALRLDRHFKRHGTRPEVLRQLPHTRVFFYPGKPDRYPALVSFGNPGITKNFCRRSSLSVCSLRVRPNGFFLEALQIIFRFIFASTAELR
jgi:hypothetical protein